MIKRFQILFLAIAGLLAMATTSAQAQQRHGQVSEQQARQFWESQTKAGQQTNYLLRGNPGNGLQHFLPRFNFRKTITVHKADGSTVTICGNVIYSENNATPKGIYSFPAEDGLTFTPIAQDDNIDAESGGVYENGKYHFMKFLHYYEYDAETWQPIRDEQLTWSNDNASLMAISLAYSPADNKVYGCFTDYSDYSYYFGTIDYEQLKTTKIATTPNIIRCMVATPQGEIYGLLDSGDLIKINKTTGEQTVVGNIGIQPASVIQGAICDPSTGTCYWAAQPSEGSAGLYEINLQDASATLISEFPNDEEVTGLYIPDAGLSADAPGQATDLKANFLNGDTTGTVSFTMPTTTTSGNELSGDLTYTVKFNDSTIATGTASAGASVTTDQITVATGKYKITVVASNASGDGKNARIDQWIGYDAPEAVTNLNATVSDSGINLSWDAPTKGVNDGYFDSNALTYTIVRNPGNVTVADHIASTSVTDNISGSDLAIYTYTVTPYNGETAGQPATTDGIKYGEAVNPPYLNTFDNESDFDFLTVIDNNNDGNSWKWDRWGKQAEFTSGWSGNDDWLVSPPIKLKKGYSYLFHFSASVSSSYNKHTFSASMGKAASAQALIKEVIPEQELQGATKTYKQEVRVDEDGTYYFGIHATTSDYEGYLDVDSFGIDEGISLAAPDSVTNLKVVAGEQGALTANISFNAPTMAANGTQLASNGISKIEIWRGEQLVKTFDAPAPGSALTYTDNDLEQGTVNYRILPYSSDGVGTEAKASVYVGFDTPAAPANIVAADKVDHIEITWDAPQKGVHGGYIDPAQTLYSIQRTDGESAAAVANNITSTSVVDNTELTGSQRQIGYGVMASNNYGQGGIGTSNSIIIGDAYTLPYKESFVNGSNASFWGINYSSNGNIGTTTNEFADNDGGAILYRGSGSNAFGTLYSGKIDLRGSKNPVLTFYVLSEFYTNSNLMVEAVTPEGNHTVLGSTDFSDFDSDGWTQISYDLSSVKSERYIQLYFKFTSEDESTELLIDNINVFDNLDDNLGVTVDAPASINVGSSKSIIATVDNLGKKAAKDYTVTLWRDGDSIASQTGSRLSAGASQLFTFNIEANAASKASSDYYVEVTYAPDENTDNNKSKTFTIKVNKTDYPTAENLTAAYNQTTGKVNLNWNAPELSSEPQTVTDYVESYEEFTINNIGDWTTFDGEPSATYTVTNGTENYQFAHSGEAKAWQVFNPIVLGIPVETDAAKAWKPYSGNQMFVAFNDVDGQDDDWLISPELSGRAQTISFWVKSFTAAYDGLETYEVRYSTNGTDTASFVIANAEAEAPVEWTRVTATLPEGARYFAIRCTSKNHFALMVDDITYENAGNSDLKIQGYNVYRNGQLITSSPVSELTYADDVTEDGSEDSYQVSVVYDKGESPACEPVTVQIPDAISAIIASGKPFDIYSINGMCVRKDVTSFKGLTRGAYIVEGHKVIVK